MNNIDIKEIYDVMFSDYPDIVTVRHLRIMLGISRHLAYSLLNDGSIHGVLIGNSYKIPKINVINYVLKEKQKVFNIRNIADS